MGSVPNVRFAILFVSIFKSKLSSKKEIAMGIFAIHFDFTCELMAKPSFKRDSGQSP